MVLRILMRKAVHKGVNAGIRAASDYSNRRNASGGSQDGDHEQNQASAGKRPKMTEQQRQAKQAIRMARRAGRITKL